MFRKLRRRGIRPGMLLVRGMFLLAALLLLRTAIEKDALILLKHKITDVLSDPATAAFLLGGELPASPAPAASTPVPEPPAPVSEPSPSPSPAAGNASDLLYFGSGTSSSPAPAPTPSPEPSPEPTPEALTYPLDPGSIRMQNGSVYAIDPASLMAEGLALPENPKVLIVHTHTCESYTPDGDDQYIPTEPYRTEDTNYNVVRVGEALDAALTERGITVIHDTAYHDSPSYNGAYNRALETIEANLAADPDIAVVIDLHRDALADADGNTYSTSCLVNGRESAQILLVSGTDSSGLDHPNWRDNLAFSFYLQAAMNAKYPGLTRPVDISQYRYNQHATRGSIILEVGCSGNTLQEALYAAELFADVCADVLQGKAVYDG